MSGPAARFFGAVAGLLVFVVVQALAQNYPLKPLRIISPFAPGGGTDIVARLIAPKLTQALGQPVIVDNRPGAGGSLGIELALRAPADGYTFALISAGYCVNPSFYKLRFDPLDDIAPVILIAQGPLLIAAHPSVPARTARDLIVLAKARPGELNFASSGQGSTGHMAGELFAFLSGARMTHVPYKGSGPALIDAIAGHISLNIGGIAASLPYVRSHRLKAIAVTTAQRVADAADIPTVAESGLPGYEVTNWQGLIAPKGLPAAIAERINLAIANALRQSDLIERFESNGLLPAGSTIPQFQIRIRRELLLWRDVANKAKIGIYGKDAE